MILKKSIIISILFLTVSQIALAGNNEVLIIGGHGGLEHFQNQFYRQVKELRQILLNDYGYEETDIQVFVGQNPDSAAVKFPLSTAKNINQYFADMAGRISSRDLFFCFLIGHGSYDNEWAKFNIVGNDLRDFDFSRLLSKIPVQKLCFINMSSASGPFIDKISNANRIVITATRNGFEKNATQFSTQFLNTLNNPETSDLNKDGLLSATEIFIATRDRVVKYYDSKNLLRPEHPLLDDDGDGYGTEMPDLLEGDGMFASEVYIHQTRAVNTASVKSETANSIMEHKKQRILSQIKELKKKKISFGEDAYYDELEKLMIELAKVNQGNN